MGLIFVRRSSCRIKKVESKVSGIDGLEDRLKNLRRMESKNLKLKKYNSLSRSLRRNLNLRDLRIMIKSKIITVN